VNYSPRAFTSPISSSTEACAKRPVPADKPDSMLPDLIDRRHAAIAGDVA
jgi:hypothetical protein